MDSDDSNSDNVQSEPVKRGRGRPRKEVSSSSSKIDDAPKRGRGRPRKDSSKVISMSDKVKKKRGRPRKQNNTNATVVSNVGRPRGRPRKVLQVELAKVHKVKGKRGRPKKQVSPEMESDESLDDPVISDVDSESETTAVTLPTSAAAPKKRGRPKKVKKDSETFTNTQGNGDNIASDLETIRAAINPDGRKIAKTAKRSHSAKASTDAPKRKRGRPPKSSKKGGPGRPRKVPVVTESSTSDVEEVQSGGGDQGLFGTEQESTGGDSAEKDSDEQVSADPVTADSVTADSVTADPVTADSVTADSVTADPVTAESEMVEPEIVEPETTTSVDWDGDGL